MASALSAHRHRRHFRESMSDRRHPQAPGTTRMPASRNADHRSRPRLQPSVIKSRQIEFADRAMIDPRPPI